MESTFNTMYFTTAPNICLIQLLKRMNEIYLYVDIMTVGREVIVIDSCEEVQLFVLEFAQIFSCLNTA